MKGWLVLAGVALSIGCHSKPKVDPQLEADSLLFCRAWEAKGRPSQLGELSKYLVDNIKSHEILDVFSSAKNRDDPRETFKELRGVFAKVGVVHCMTLDWLEARYERTDHGNGP